jgi:hypothetical protein
LYFGDSPTVFGILEYLWSKEAVEGVSEWATPHRGAPGPPGAPWWVVPTQGRLSVSSSVHRVSSGLEKFHKKFRCVWTLFDRDFL